MRRIANARTEPTEEIDVTPAMIRAGEDAMRQTQDPVDGDISVFAIFVAMLAASPQFKNSVVRELE